MFLLGISATTALNRREQELLEVWDMLSCNI